MKKIDNKNSFSPSWIPSKLKDGTEVQAQWTNRNPNIKGPQVITNGPAPCWISFNDGPWLRSCCRDGRYTMKVKDAIEISDTRQDLITLLDLQPY